MFFLLYFTEQDVGSVEEQSPACSCKSFIYLTDSEIIAFLWHLDNVIQLDKYKTIF